MPKTPKIKSLASGKRLTIIGAILLAIAGFFWWTNVFNNPENVFFGMLDNSLATSSVTRQVKEESAGGSVERFTRLQTGITNAAETLEITKQGQATVTKETVGTPDTDYARYAKIETNQTTESGQPADFSSVEGAWGKSTEEQSAQVQYFNQAFLGTVPFASMNGNDRRELIQFMRDNNVYKVSYADVEKTTENGRKVYVYKVGINPTTYFEMLQQFVKKLGLPEIAGLDPSQYAGVADLETEFKIDKNSRQLVEIKYLGTGQQEFYSDHGLNGQIQIPEQTIPITELQTRIQNLQ